MTLRCRVVTWNVHACVGTDWRHDPGRIARVLASIDADVVGLQEIDWRRETDAGKDQLDFLAAELGMNAVAGPNLRDHRGHYGNGLLTRFEVAGVRRLQLAWRAREPRGAIDARLRHPGGEIRALVTHLGLHRSERREQSEILRNAIDEGDPETPTVLMGDLNEWRPARFVPPMLVPSPFPAVALGRTFPSLLPCFLLDRILVRPAPSGFSFDVVRTAAARAASDHLPLVAEIRWDVEAGAQEAMEAAAPAARRAGAR